MFSGVVTIFALSISLILFRQMSDVVGGREWVGFLGGGVGGWWAGCSERLNQQTTTTTAKAAIRMMTRTPAHGEINVCDLPIMWVILPAFWVCVSGGVNASVWVCIRGGVCVSVCVRLVITAVSISGRQARLRCQFHKQFTQTARGAKGHRGESHSICQLLRLKYIFRGGKLSGPPN